ncbi:MAG: hypothetical protein ACYC1D_08300 [Acidimicrobiales bacterium]
MERRWSYIGRPEGLVELDDGQPGFVQHAVGVALDDVAGWGAMLAEALRDSGGGMSAEQRR